MSRNPLLREQLPVFPGQMNPQADGLEVPVGIPAQPYQPSQPQALGVNPTRLVDLPGADFPPAGALPLDIIGDGDIAAAATATLVTITVPDTYRVRVAGIGFSADDETALRFLRWLVFVTPPASTITGYVNMPAAIGSVSQLSPVFILQGSSVTLEVRATNTSAVPVSYHYVCRVQGWFYSQKEN